MGFTVLGLVSASSMKAAMSLSARSISFGVPAIATSVGVLVMRIANSPISFEVRTLVRSANVVRLTGPASWRLGKHELIAPAHRSLDSIAFHVWRSPASSPSSGSHCIGIGIASE